MKSLMILVTTTAIVSGLRETSPGFAVDFRTFGAPRHYQDSPYREQSRGFREAGPYRPESYRDYRPPPFTSRDERIFRAEDPRESFRTEARDGFREEPRSFRDEARGSFREDRFFRNELRGPRTFREESRGAFRDENRGTYKDEIRGSFKDETRGSFKVENRGPFREDSRQFRDENYREQTGQAYRDDLVSYDGPPPARHFREEQRPLGNEAGPFGDEANSGFREVRPFSGQDEAGPERGQTYRDEAGRFKDEIMFTEESRSLAEAQHRFDKEQQNRQPLSYGGHSNYLKFGNHGLGYASIPSTILPLEENTPELSSSIIQPEIKTTASTQSPNFLKNSIQEATTAAEEVSITTKSRSGMPVTLAPEVPSTSNQIATSGVNNQQNLVEAGSKSPSSMAISTSGDASVTPRVLFTSGQTSMTDSPMRINEMENENGVQRAHEASINSHHASKQGINVLATPGSYYQSETRPEVPEGLLNYVFKYQTPDDTKVRYTFRNTFGSDALNQFQAYPASIRHQQPQPAKYTILPDLKVSSALSTVQQSPSFNYVLSNNAAKIPYLTSNAQGFTLGSGYTPDNSQTVNFGGNLIQLDRQNNFTPIGGQSERLPILQSNQYSNQLGQFSSNDYLTQLGQYGNLGQQRQIANTPFTQGGLQLQLGGFGGIDLNALSSNTEASRLSYPADSSLRDASGQAGAAFGKFPFGESMWQL